MRIGVELNGAELCVDTIGDPSRPAVLLVMGAAASMDRWEEPFCERLAAAGRYVIRYDHRDTGGSTTYPPGEPGYSGDDLVADALGILDRLAIERAHFVGLSMGGGIVQRIAVDHPERVLSITLMSTSPTGTGGPELPPMSDALRASFDGDEPRPSPTGPTARPSSHTCSTGERPYTGSRGLDEAAMRDLLGRVYDRSTSMASATNHFLVDGTDTARSRLARDQPCRRSWSTAPTTRCSRPPTGRRSRVRSPARGCCVIDGLGHELPPSAWDEVLPALIAVTG